MGHNHDASNKRIVDMTSSGSVKLKRRLSLHHGVGVIVGLVVGSGIYIAPKGVLARAGSPGLSLLIWLISGFGSTLGALCAAELGTTFQASGDTYVYLQKMFGPFAAFCYLWTYLFMLRCGGNATKLLTFARYVLQPWVEGGGGCSHENHALVSLLACSLACLLTFINIVRVKWAAHGQSFLSTISVLALIIISISGIVWMVKGNTEHLENPFEGTTTNPADIVLALYSGIFATGGWNALNFMVEELKDPYKNLPRAIYISMGLVTVLYVAVNLAYIAVLGPNGILESDAVALTFAQRTLGPAAWLMLVFIVLNMVGSFNSGTLVASRLCFVGARSGHLPDVLALISVNFLSPMTSLIFQCVLVVLLCWTVDLYTLLNNVIFAKSFFEALTVIGMLYLRWKKPDLKRPLKVPIIIPILSLLFRSMLVIIPLVMKPKATVVGLVIIVCSGVPYYVIFIIWNSKPRSFLEWGNNLTRWIQKLLYCVKQEEEIEMS